MGLDLVLVTLMDGREQDIINEFGMFREYRTSTINVRINKILGGKFNKYTTTQIFNYLFKTEATVIKEKGVWDRKYKIIGLK